MAESLAGKKLPLEITVFPVPFGSKLMSPLELSDEMVLPEKDRLLRLVPPSSV